MAAIDLDAFQAVVGIWWSGLHPKETIVDYALALAEETGEVCRAVLKRSRNDPRADDWDVEVRKETVDAFVNLLIIAHSEGFSLADSLIEYWLGIQDRAESRQRDRAP